MERFTLSKPIFVNTVNDDMKKQVEVDKVYSVKKYGKVNLPEAHPIVVGNELSSEEESDEPPMNNTVSNNERKIINEEQFWTYITSLEWLDKSEFPAFQINHKKNQFKSLNVQDQQAFIKYLNMYIGLIDVKFKSVDFYGNITDINEQRAICSHIIGKGKTFYIMSAEDPGFASYFITENENEKEYHNMLKIIQ